MDKNLIKGIFMKKPGKFIFNDMPEQVLNNTANKSRKSSFATQSHIHKSLNYFKSKINGASEMKMGSTLLEN